MAITPTLPEQKTNTAEIGRIIKKGGSSIKANAVKPTYQQVHLRFPQSLLDRIDNIIKKRLDKGIPDSRSRWIIEILANGVEKEEGELS